MSSTGHGLGLCGLLKPEPGRSLALAVLSASYFTFVVGSLAILGLIVPISEELGVTSSDTALLITAFGITYAAAAPLLQTMVGDRERKGLVIAGLGGIAFGALVASYAPNMQTMALSRVLMGFGSALVAPMALAMGSALMPPQQQSQVLALY